jgi:hypothetical protein
MDQSAKRLTGLALACFAISLAWTLIGSEEKSGRSAPPPARIVSSAAVTVPPAAAVSVSGRALVRDLARFSPQLYRILRATEQAHAEVEQLQHGNRESPSSPL